MWNAVVPEDFHHSTLLITDWCGLILTIVDYSIYSEAPHHLQSEAQSLCCIRVGLFMTSCESQCWMEGHAAGGASSIIKHAQSPRRAVIVQFTLAL